MRTYFPGRAIPLSTLLALLLSACSPHANRINLDSALAALEKAHAHIHRFVLDNGMICLVKEDHSAPVAAIQIWVASGAIHEGPYLGAGISHAIEHMIFKGTPTRPPGTITRQINDAGGYINAYTAQDRTVFHTTIPSRHWVTALDVLADAVMHADFPAQEWEKERHVILREMAMGRDDPGRVLDKLLWATAFRVHPFRYPVIGYESPFRSISRNDLVTHFRKHYVPDAMIFVAVGDIDATDVERRVRAAFADFHRRRHPPAPIPAEPRQVSPRFARKTGDYNVSRIVTAWHTTSLTDPDTPALDVLAAVTGHGRSSSLVRKLRERQKLVYEVDAWSYTPAQPGLFGITAVFNPKHEDALRRALSREVSAWTSELFPNPAVARAQRNIVVDELSSMQTMDGQAGAIASAEFYAGDPAFSVRYLRRVLAVKPCDLRRVARHYLTPDNQTTVILSPKQTAARPSPVRTASAKPPEKIALPGNLPLIVREDHRLPFVHLCIALRGGLLVESNSDNGVTRLMSTLLLRGTAHHSAAQLDQIFDSMGATVAPFSGANSFGIQARCLSADFPRLAEILAECLCEPSFPPEEFVKERDAQAAAASEQRERPFFIARESLRRTLFPGHPYSLDPLGTPASLTNITPESVRREYQRLVSRSNMTVAVFGDITPADARRVIAPALKDLPAHPSDLPARPVPEPVLPARVKRRVPREQAIVLVGYPGLKISDPRLDAARILENAFSGLASDLAVEIREKRGLVYYVGAFQRPGIDPGLFAFYAGTREDAVPSVIDLISNEVARVRNEGLRPEEFRRARDRLIAQYHMRLQNNGDLAQNCALDELFGLGYDYPFHFEERMNKVSPDQVRAVARTIFTERRATVVVLPAKEPSKESKASGEDQDDEK